MGALEYELNKAMKGRGSAVAAVLGLKPSDTGSLPAWNDESSAPRLFDPGTLSSPRRPSVPALPPVRTGTTGALPLSADEDKIRVNSSSRLSSAETVPLDESKDPDFKEARLAKKRPWGLIAGLFVLLAAGVGVWKLLRPTTPEKKPTPIETTATLERKETRAPDTKKRAVDKDDEKMSPAEIDRMLEWARRCIEGGRIIAPPGDNLKELLDRIDHADPGNAQAEALRAKATNVIQRRGVLALKKNRLDEAQKAFEALTVLKPNNEYARGRLARTLGLRALRSLDKNRFAAAVADATAALEITPDDTGTQLTLADVHLAMGKHELAAEEYQRVLDVKPADKRALGGLARANAAKQKPIKKKRAR
jgi:tetratricopeptide (TPR) repeat protein